MPSEKQQPFSDIPLEDHSVGHAGLYVPEEGDSIDEKHQKLVNALGVISETITNDIPLGLDKGGKTLIDCETGIKAFVKDHLAGTKENPVNNHLPNTETGVWIYYLTQGIERDFGRTWEVTPKSIREKLSKEAKAAASGKRVITKKEKNDLIAKRDMGYWLPMVSAGICRPAGSSCTMPGGSRCLRPSGCSTGIGKSACIGATKRAPKNRSNP